VVFEKNGENGKTRLCFPDAAVLCLELSEDVITPPPAADAADLEGTDEKTIGKYLSECIQWFLRLFRRLLSEKGLIQRRNKLRPRTVR
jgi:hypothetical protein